MPALLLGGPLHYTLSDYPGIIIKHGDTVYSWDGNGCFVCVDYEPTTHDLLLVKLMALDFNGHVLCLGGELHGRWVPRNRGVNGYSRLLGSDGRLVGYLKNGVGINEVPNGQQLYKLMLRCE